MLMPSHDPSLSLIANGGASLVAIASSRSEPMEAWADACCGTPTKVTAANSATKTEFAFNAPDPGRVFVQSRSGGFSARHIGHPCADAPAWPLAAHHMRSRSRRTGWPLYRTNRTVTIADAFNTKRPPLVKNAPRLVRRGWRLAEAFGAY